MRLRDPEPGAASDGDRDPVAVVHAAIDAGVILLDTAEMYGNEELVGRTVRGRRDEVLLCSKFGVRWGDSGRFDDWSVHADAATVVSSCERSLRRLDVDVIDLYYLHHRSEITPIDFIAALRPTHDLPGHHEALLANCFAQSEAFMAGKYIDEVRDTLAAQGLDAARIEALAPHWVCPGNRPSNTILMDQLTPLALGALIALYEHKTFVQGVLWDINSFDQWGVELGKSLARAIEDELTGTARPERHDSSTNGLIALARAASAAY